ncbi:MAG: transglycosylase domain-containing protein [Faecalibacterium sp.]|jgi:membrane peptidoglycan carboxypeptidase|nr:transglycosylase domain-containing protein [Faecalibacterium sp.]
MKKKWIRRSILVLLCLAVLALASAGGVVLYRGYQMYRQALAAAPLEEKIAGVRAQPGYTSLSALPAIYPDAVVCVEDKRFYSHFGIDPISITRAVFTNLAAGSLQEGGSTITQQLAKNLYFSQEKRFERKAAEMFMAFALEKSCSKDEILELYINCIYYGSGYSGIYDASEGYFGKTPALLTDAECTLLAGLPNAPSAYSPDESPALALQRQKQVLTAMVKNKKLTQQKADALLAQSSSAIQ